MKKILAIIMCVIICFGAIGCTKTQTEKETCKHENLGYITLDTDESVGILCQNCNYIIGYAPERISTVEVEKIVEKEVIKEVEVPVEVEKIVEKEVIKEVEVLTKSLPTDCTLLTTEDVSKITNGTVLNNVFTNGSSFVSKFVKESVAPKNTEHGTQDVYLLHVECLDNIKIYIDYSCYGDYSIKELPGDYETWNNIGILSGTVQNVVRYTDSYRNTQIEIYMKANTVKMESLFDYLPYKVGYIRG